MTTERIKTYLLFVSLGVILLLWLCRGCGKDIVNPPMNTYKHRQDSFRTIIKYRDSTRVKDLIKWRNLTRITDSAPCYTQIIPIIQACDTIIVHDSIEIVSLKGLDSLDSTIIALKTDTIKTLRLKLKWQKVKTKVAFIVGLGSGGVLGFKLH